MKCLYHINDLRLLPLVAFVTIGYDTLHRAWLLNQLKNVTPWHYTLFRNFTYSAKLPYLATTPD